MYLKSDLFLSPTLGGVYGVFAGVLVVHGEHAAGAKWCVCNS